MPGVRRSELDMLAAPRQLAAGQGKGTAIKGMTNCHVNQNAQPNGITRSSINMSRAGESLGMKLSSVADAIWVIDIGTLVEADR